MNKNVNITWPKHIPEYDKTHKQMNREHRK